MKKKFEKTFFFVEGNTYIQQKMLIEGFINSMYIIYNWCIIYQLSECTCHIYNDCQRRNRTRVHTEDSFSDDFGII